MLRICYQLYSSLQEYEETKHLASSLFLSFSSFYLLSFHRGSNRSVKKLFVLDKNIWYDITIYKLFELKIFTWSLSYLNKQNHIISLLLFFFSHYSLSLLVCILFSSPYFLSFFLSFFIAISSTASSIENLKINRML